jgi:hypothetical protein
MDNKNNHQTDQDKDGVVPSENITNNNNSNNSHNNNPPPTSAPGPDPFDPANLRLSQDFGATLGVKKALLTVPVRKPAREWWIRVHPDPAYHVETAVLELKEDREVYLVDPHLWPELSTESTFGPRAIFTAVNTLGVVFLWPIRLPGPDGKIDEWNRSALETALLGKDKWVRIQANMSLGAYEVLTSDNEKPAAWPQVSFRDLLQIAFKEKFITTLDHPVVKKLRGVL